MSSKVEVIRELIKHEHESRIDAPSDYSFFHPSEFYQCVRKLAYNYYGLGKDRKIKPDLRRVFDNGDHMHLRYTGYFENLNILYGAWECKNPLCKKIFGENEKLGIQKPVIKCDNCGCDEYKYIEVTAGNDEYMISGHIDGILKLGGEYSVIDYKSMHANQFTSLNEPMDKHIIQVEIYLWLLDLKTGFLLYENKDSQKIKLFEVVYNEDLIAKILKRLEAIRDIVKNNKLPKRPFEKDSSQCKVCDFNKICWKKSVNEAE